MNQTLDEDGMFLPGPPEPGPSNVDANKDTLLKSNGEFESSQRSPDRKRLQNGGKNSIPNKRACHDRHNTSALEKKIQSSESSIQKIKVHAEKKTCPKDQRYKVQVNIAPDEDFKNDINRNRPGKERANHTDNVISLATELANKLKKVEELMKSLENKKSESYPCVFTDSLVKGRDVEKRIIRNNRNHTRRSNRRREKRIYNDKINRGYIKNLSNCEMTSDQINLLSKGLKFIPTPAVKDNAVRKTTTA